MKKAYKRPMLRQHGAVERVTLGMAGSGGDMMAMMAMA
mgnify:CR=1 FL=1|jgi:hypothetical protein